MTAYRMRFLLYMILAAVAQFGAVTLAAAYHSYLALRLLSAFYLVFGIALTGVILRLWFRPGAPAQRPAVFIAQTILLLVCALSIAESLHLALR